MSMEVYIQCFKDGAPSGVPRDKVRAAFGQFLTETEPRFWSVRYDDENGCDVAVDACEDDASLVYSLCIERPCGDKRLWDALAAILKLGTVVLYFPGGASPLVAVESVVGHLPPDMVESLGTPVCIQTGDEIVRHIDAA
jgi:hypothetical protein